MNEKLKIPAISGAVFFLLLCDQDFMMNQLDTIILMRRTSEIHPEQPRTHMMMECVRRAPELRTIIMNGREVGVYGQQRQQQPSKNNLISCLA